MTVREYMDKRSATQGFRKVRVISLSSKSGVGDWTLYADRKIIKINVTSKYTFIYVQ